MAKKQKWFKNIRGSYLPSSFIGTVIYMLYVLYLTALMVGWWRNDHRLWYLVIFVIPLSVGAAVLTQAIASKHSK